MFEVKVEIMRSSLPYQLVFINNSFRFCFFVTNFDENVGDLKKLVSFFKISPIQVKVEIMRSSLPYQLVFMVDLKNVWVESGWK